MVADNSVVARPEEEDGDDRTIQLAWLLKTRTERLLKWVSISPRAPAHLVHEEMRLVYEAFEDISTRVGMEKGDNCTQCDEGFYSNDHCTYCYHEQYQ
tara:strand:- start:574 stop:867 length:294 start_codon:yes stop_codon:yes gene_type:complete